MTGGPKSRLVGGLPDRVRSGTYRFHSHFCVWRQMAVRGVSVLFCLTVSFRKIPPRFTIRIKKLRADAAGEYVPSLTVPPYLQNRRDHPNLPSSSGLHHTAEPARPLR